MVEITKVGVVGCGLMGSGIAEVCARAGFDTVVREMDEALLARGMERLQSSMSGAVERGSPTPGRHHRHHEPRPQGPHRR